MSSNIQMFNFQGDRLEVVKQGEDLFVSLHAVCDALGIAPQRQAVKLAGKEWATTTMMVAVAADGKRREVVGVHLDTLPMWLATISPSKVAEAVRPKLVTYQREAARVLADHFLGRRQDALTMTQVAAAAAAAAGAAAGAEAAKQVVERSQAAWLRRQVKAAGESSATPAQRPVNTICKWLASEPVGVIDVTDLNAWCAWASLRATWRTYRAWAVGEGYAPVTRRTFRSWLLFAGAHFRGLGYTRFRFVGQGEGTR